MFELQTFGTVGVRTRDGDRSEAHIVQTKRLGLLIYLALAPRRRCRRRDQVVSLFWPDLDQEHARGALSQALRYLRRALVEEVIITQGEEEIGVNRDLLGCDATAFTALCGSEHLEAALELYKGPFLDGFFVTDAAREFEQWMLEERARYRTQATQVALRLAETAEQAANLKQAVDWARRAAAISPGEEVVAARLIRLLDEGGDRAGALRVYESLRQLLKDEFEIARRARLMP